MHGAERDDYCLCDDGWWTNTTAWVSNAKHIKVDQHDALVAVSAKMPFQLGGSGSTKPVNSGVSCSSMHAHDCTNCVLTIIGNTMLIRQSYRDQANILE